MEPRIINLKAKKIVGKQIIMSLLDNKTGELWQAFMQKRAEIKNRLSNDYISMSLYEPGYFSDFHPGRKFKKWAAVEIDQNGDIPAGMESYIIEDGLYAVFDYKGSSTDTRIFQYIFGSWLPASEYLVDNRPHFEVLGEKYRNNDPESEEEIWIPVRLSTSVP